MNDIKIIVFLVFLFNIGNISDSIKKHHILRCNKIRDQLFNFTSIEYNRAREACFDIKETERALNCIDGVSFWSDLISDKNIEVLKKENCSII